MSTRKPATKSEVVEKIAAATDRVLGGIQEEAPSLGKPVLVMRDVTERMEGVAAGTARLVGTNAETIIREASRLLDDRSAYDGMARAINPYGDGTSCLRIVKIMEQWMQGEGARSV